jgi:putrescine transport system ATP-binding protein
LSDAASLIAGPAMRVAGAAAPLVSIAGVTKRFGGLSAVDGVSLEIARGEFFALLGPSGCGKTTLLRMLAGFETPDSGRILIDGIDMTDVPPYARPVNMMFQSYALFPHMSVQQNVAFGLRQERVAKPAIRERVAAVLDLVQLGALGERRPHQLSGGQRQRVALARALVKQPKLLLLDEPLAALDRKLREQTQFELVRIQERVGITFVVVTHDQAEAMTMASRIAVMDGGKLRQIGRPAEVYEAPASRFVADFIGTVNFLPGIVRGTTDRGLAIDSPDVGPLRLTSAPATPDGAAVTVALRPEKIAMGRTPAAGGDNRCAGIVREVAYLGGVSFYRVALPSGAVLKVSLPNAERDAATQFSRDEPVFLSWSADAGLVLSE